MPTWAISGAARSGVAGCCSSCRPGAQLPRARRRCCCATPARRCKNPFFFLAPEWFRLPLRAARHARPTFIASQAVISGAFSVTQQAIQLGFMPRMSIKHTSATAAGQIYIPVINWALMIAVILLVLVFQHSSNLAAAYGIAVTGAMLIDTFLLAVVLFAAVEVEAVAGDAAARACSSCVDGAYLRRQPDQDSRWRLGPAARWALVIFTLLTTWSQGPRADAREHGRGRDPDRGLRQERRIPAPRACRARRSS